MIQVWILALFIAFPAFAQELTHVKLSPVFRDYLKAPQMKSARQTKSLSAGGSGLGNIIGSVFLGNNSAFPTDGETSPLYQEIRDQLEAAHQEIGLREVTQLDFLNRQFNLGTENLSGFSWQKPFGVVHVFADRQVTPNLFGSNWLIQDTFTFDVEATTFLERAAEAGLVAMSSLEIGAFAGITFKRVYTYYHYANSYREGLTADFSKLFLPFLKMNSNSISRMGHEEILKRHDSWTARAGGLITTPPLYNFSFSAGVLAEYAYEQQVAAQSFSVNDATAEKVRLSVKGTKTASAAATLSLQLDFFKLLQLTILSADLTYEYSAAKEYTLGMSVPEWNHVLQGRESSSELGRILRGTGMVKVLEPYVIRLDEAESSSLQTKGSLLVWGRLQKQKTEQVRIIKDGVVNVFYKNYAQSLRIVQNIFSRLFSAVVYKLLKLPLGVKNAAMMNREVTLEYKATHAQAADPKIARINGTEEFSFVLQQSYEAARTHRWIDAKFKNDVIWFIDVFTTLPKDYKTIVRREELKGPILVNSTVRIEKAGFDYFLGRTENDVFRAMAEVCESEFVSEWANAVTRKELLRDWENDEFCVKDLGDEYLAFKKDYHSNFLKPSLARFKTFLTRYYKLTQSLGDIQVLFGAGNTFVHGQLQATTPQGTAFVTSFSSGQFRGLGVIDNFKRETVSRSPASIVSE